MEASVVVVGFVDTLTGAVVAVAVVAVSGVPLAGVALVVVVVAYC